MLLKDTLDEVRMYTMHYDKLYEVKIGLNRELDGKSFITNVFHYRYVQFDPCLNPEFHSIHCNSENAGHHSLQNAVG